MIYNHYTKLKFPKVLRNKSKKICEKKRKNKTLLKDREDIRKWKNNIMFTDGSPQYLNDSRSL